MVEHIGFEPMTSSMPWMRATNCANAPCVVIRRVRYSAAADANAPNYEVIRLSQAEPSYYTILTCKNQLQNLEYHIDGR